VPALDILSAHSAPPSEKQKKTAVKTEKVQATPQTHPFQKPPPYGDPNTLNPFALSPPTSLKLWHDARTSLSNPAYFYTTMRKFGSINEVVNRGADGVKDEDEGERFPVRMREVILEVEQGVADLRMLLNECLRVEDAGALRALRDRVNGALVFK
jgi:hypothetical protein